LARLSEVLARFSLSPEFIWQALNNAVIFLSVLFFANATLVWMLMLFTSSADSITGWAVRIAFLTLLDIGCASSSLQLGKVHFARKIEKQVTDGWWFNSERETVSNRNAAKWLKSERDRKTG